MRINTIGQDPGSSAVRSRRNSFWDRRNSLPSHSPFSLLLRFPLSHRGKRHFSPYNTLIWTSWFKIMDFCSLRSQYQRPKLRAHQSQSLLDVLRVWSSMPLCRPPLAQPSLLPLACRLNSLVSVGFSVCSEKQVKPHLGLLLERHQSLDCGSSLYRA